MAGQDADRRPGRRTGDSGTREQILTTALEMFADRGYDATSVRAIARQAGVDPGLVRHFFGSKEKLFTTAVVDRSDVPRKMFDALTGPADHLGERLVRTYFDLWESEETGPMLQTLFRSAVSNENLAPLFVETMVASLRGRSVDPATVARISRIPLAAPQILGVAVCRYVLRIPALVDVPLDDLVARLAPVVQQDLGR